MPKFLRRPAVTERYGVPASTIYDWISKGLFPKPVRLGKRAVGWALDELEVWEQAKAADRDNRPKEDVLAALSLPRPRVSAGTSV